MERLMVGGLSGSEVQGVETKALFATVDGTIGIVASLSEEKFLLLEKVEKKMEEQDMSLGGIEHARYLPPSIPSATRGGAHRAFSPMYLMLIVGGVHLRMDGRKR